MRRLSAWLFLVALLAWLTPVTFAQTFTTFDVPSSTLTEPAAINAWGAITGSYGASGTLGNRGFLRRPGGVVFTFDVPEYSGRDHVVGTTAINALDQIIGYVLDLNVNRYHSFLRQPDGTFATLEVGGPCPVSGAKTRYSRSAFLMVPIQSFDGDIPVTINNKGQIAGIYGQLGCHYSFLRQRDGTTIRIEVPTHAEPGPQTLAQAMNSRGQVTGYYLADNHNLQGFLWEPNGTITTFGPPDSNVLPTAITGRGEIAGSLDGHGFLRQPDGTISTFDPADSISTYPVAMNARGQISGYYSDMSLAYHGFLREKDGSIVTFDVPDSTNTYPTSMNAAGQITGWYSDANGVVHGFVRKCRKPAVAMHGNQADGSGSESPLSHQRRESVVGSQ